MLVGLGRATHLVTCSLLLLLRSSISSHCEGNAMSSLPISGIFLETKTFCSHSLPLSRPSSANAAAVGFPRGKVISQSLCTKDSSQFAIRGSSSLRSKKVLVAVPRCSGSSDSNSSGDDSAKPKQSFGYSRKDVLLIGLGVTVLGVGMKSGLEYVGVDPLQAGNVVQLVLVLGLTVGWISTYIFRVSNKEMTYAQQLRDYEYKVMEKRLEGLSEAELQALLQQVEEDKTRLASRDQVN